MKDLVSRREVLNILMQIGKQCQEDGGDWADAYDKAFFNINMLTGYVTKGEKKDD